MAEIKLRQRLSSGHEHDVKDHGGASSDSRGVGQDYVLRQHSHGKSFHHTTSIPRCNIRQDRGSPLGCKHSMNVVILLVVNFV